MLTAKINTYARNIIGFDVTSSVQLLLITNAVGIPVRPIAGWLANNVVGPINTYVVSMFVLCSMQFAWMGVQDRAGMYAFAVFYGIAGAVTQGIFIGALASLTKDPTKMGARSGIVYLVSAFATMAGPPTAGAIIDRSGGDYFWAQVWAGIVVALAAGCLAASRYWTTGLVWRVKV